MPLRYAEKMKTILCFAALLATGFCQPLLDDIITEANLIFTNASAKWGCDGISVTKSEVIFTLYTQNSRANGTVLNETNVNLVDSSVRTIFIIHGWLQSSQIGWILQMKEKYLDLGDANVITVDWSTDANAFYSHSTCAVPQVGEIVGNLIYNLNETGRLDLNATRLIGFSLGGHVTGYAGQVIKNVTGGRLLGIIVGLDVAGPGFIGRPTEARLDASDARLVQGYHTSNKQFGYTDSYATIDFHIQYVPILGCGVKQPGCPLEPGVPTDGGLLEAVLPRIFCDHVRAAAYYIESISSTKFIAHKCRGCRSFGLGLCSSTSGNTVVMGEHYPEGSSGAHYLNVNSNSPFAQGT